MDNSEARKSLPTVPFGPQRITRLVAGGNPFVANSHFSSELNQEMAGYFTPERVVATLKRCEEAGINAVQARGDYHRIMHYLELFRREGGKLHFIAQTASEMHDIHHNIRVLAAFGATGIYFHGTKTDELWMAGKIDQARDYLKTIRDTGLQAGISSHIPEVLEYVEDKNWDVDFYMACLYNISRKPRESAVVTGKFVTEEFIPEDPPRMCSFIRQTVKPCLAYKILGANRLCQTQDQVKKAFAWAFANIKPNDAVVVGMFPKYIDQPSLNVGYTLEAIAAAEARKKG